MDLVLDAMKDLLINYDETKERKFNQFWTDLGDIESKSILWYPSSGVLDLRPVVLLLDKEVDRVNINQKKGLKKVDLFLYNSLSTGGFHKFIDERNSLLFKDERTRITLEEVILTMINRNVFNYFINPSYFSGHIENSYSIFPDSAIMKIKIESDIHGIQYSWLIYFEAENHNFFNQSIIRHRIPITYLCNVREGLGFGLCGKSFLEIFIEGYLPSGDAAFRPKFLLRNDDYVLKKLKKDRDNQLLAPMCRGKYARLKLINQYNWDNHRRFGGMFADMYKITYDD